jgi:hypothetical protein
VAARVPTSWTRDGRLAPGGVRSWQAVVFLLGAEATALLVWHVSEEQYSYVRRGTNDLASLALGFAPFVTVLVSLRARSVKWQPKLAALLLGLTLVGPGLIVVHLTLVPHFLQGPGGLIVTPACAGVAAGIAGAGHGRLRVASLLLLCGGVIGFLVVALPMWMLGIGTVADCPVGCNSLEMRGLSGTAIVVGVIGFATSTPGFAVGWLLAGRAGR